MKLSNIFSLNNKNADYRCIISGTSKIAAIKLLQYIALTETSKYYKK